MPVFKTIRETALDNWNTELNRKREDGGYSDNYSESNLCNWQNECLAVNKHCSFICSFGDWLDNISDLLRDPRFDQLLNEEPQVLFRFYTKILLILSEIIEDIITLDKNVKEYNGKKDATAHIEIGYFGEGELKAISEFINSVCKHKTERDNLHIHNHHLKIEFVDFGDKEHENQIRLNNQDWTTINKNTTILIPELSYFIQVIIRLNKRFDNLLKTEDGYKERLFALYADEWPSSS